MERAFDTAVETGLGPLPGYEARESHDPSRSGRPFGRPSRDGRAPFAARVRERGRRTSALAPQRQKLGPIGQFAFADIGTAQIMAASRDGQR